MQGKPPAGRARTNVARLAAFAAAAALTAAAAWVLPYFPIPWPAAAPGRDPLPPGTYHAAPLAPGEAAPPFEATGWLNGPPPAPGEGGPRLVVVDLWSDW
jgi:hypothetical protein